MYKQCCIYIMSNKWNTVLYTGVTSDLSKRVEAHKEKVVDGFTKRYNVTKLVYYEVFENMENAILREKRLKGSSRKRKADLITRMNPQWRDLSEELWI